MNRMTFLIALALATLLPAAGEAQKTGWTFYHVATTGSDANPGTAEQPFRTINKAVGLARPATRIFVHAGTYAEVVEAKTSGARGFPIVLKGAGDGEVVIKPNLPSLSCGGLSPTRERAILVLNGLDHWRIRGLTVVGGILVSGKSKRDISEEVWNRALPGRGSYDPAAAATTLPLLGTDPADHVEIWENKIVGRGIYAMTARYGSIANNEVANIECGTGGGIWIGRFSDGWAVRGNFVHHIAQSVEHSLTEGIRLVGMSMYNLVESNVVEDVAGDGRGLSTDVNAGWNTFRWNTARRTAKGMNEQTGAWGNTWVSNLSEDNRGSGFSIDMKDNDLPVPDDGVPAYLQITCNVARRNVNNDLEVGALQATGFEGNGFGNVQLMKNVRDYWKDSKNTWNGSPEPPVSGTTEKGAGCP